MHVTVYLICALVTALMAAYGIWRTIRIAHLGTTSKLAVTAFFALAGASHFAFLDMTDLFERAFIVDTLPVTGLFGELRLALVLPAGARARRDRRRARTRAQEDGASRREARPLHVSSRRASWPSSASSSASPRPGTRSPEPTVEPMTVAVRNLPPELEGFKVAQITDLHASNLFPAARTEAVGEGRQ